MKNILITGCSSGLGYSFTNYYLEKGYKVYGISRRKPNIKNENFIYKSCDLSDIKNIEENLKTFIQDIKELDIVYLNAGMLGRIDSSFDIKVDEMKEVYELNVYANKELLDILKGISVKTLITISSGAAVNGSKGWASYSLSKAGVNMLVNLYSKEMLNTKLLALAPGVIETPMTDYIRFELDDEEFPSAKRLKNGEILKADDAVERIDKKIIENIDKFESGSFIDIRNC